MASYPGVPPLLNDEILAADLVVALGTIGTTLLSALQSPQRWGIYDSSGNQLGNPSANGLNFIESAALALISQPTLLSTVSVDYMKEMKVSDFPIENGGFAGYNKVETPGNPVVSLAYSGSVSAGAAFLAAIDAACKSTNLYSVATPTATYTNVTVERYTYKRSAAKGASLLVVEISLKEIRQVTATYAKVPVVNPQNVSAAAQTNSGMVQTTTPDSSTLLSLYSSFNALAP